LPFPGCDLLSGRRLADAITLEPLGVAVVRGELNG
jgi:hypothetical protein